MVLDILYFHSDPWGKMIQFWRAYFSNGLKLNHQLDNNRKTCLYTMDPIGISWNKAPKVDWIWSLVRIPLEFFSHRHNRGWHWLMYVSKEFTVKDKVSILPDLPETDSSSTWKWMIGIQRLQ